MIALGEKLSAAYQTQWLGKESEVLLEEHLPEGWVGYTPEYIRVTVPDCPVCGQGVSLPVRLTEIDGEGMKGEIL